MQPLNFRLRIFSDLVLDRLDKSLIIEYYHVKEGSMYSAGLQANVNSKRKKI